MSAITFNTAEETLAAATAARKQRAKEKRLLPNEALTEIDKILAVGYGDYKSASNALLAIEKLVARVG